MTRNQQRRRRRIRMARLLLLGVLLTAALVVEDRDEVGRRSAVVIDLDALELPDCAGCGEKSKRVRCRTMDLDGPGRTGAIYTCRNVRCRKRREVIGRYFLRREMYGDH